MEKSNRSFIKKMNNELTSHQKGEQQTVVSLGVLFALCSMATVARADQMTDDSAPETYSIQYNNYDPEEYQIQVTDQPIINDPAMWNLQVIHRRSIALYQQILMHNANRLNRSFNVNRFLNQRKAFHQELAPQSLQLPKSSVSKRVNHQQALFLIKLQILVALYILFRNFVPLSKPKDKRKSKIRGSKMMTRPNKRIHKKKIVNVIITFHDIYGSQDGLNNPNKVVKSGMFDRTYIVTSPAHWAFIRSSGMLANRVKFNYQEGNQILNVVPVYRGLTYRYNRATGTLEFTHGTLNNIDAKSFLDNEHVPEGIPAHKIISVKFARLTHIVDILDIRKMFTYNSDLQLINVKGFVFNRHQPRSKVSQRVPEGYHHERVAQSSKSLASHQAKMNALNELSIIIGGLDDEHRQDN